MVPMVMVATLAMLVLVMGMELDMLDMLPLSTMLAMVSLLVQVP